MPRFTPYGQHEGLRERIDHAEGKVMMVVAAIDAVQLHVAQGILHPAHVPFVGKSQPAVLHRHRDARPCRGFLRDHGRRRAALGDNLVELTQEIHSFQIFAPPINVRCLCKGGLPLVRLE